MFRPCMQSGEHVGTKCRENAQAAMPHPGPFGWLATEIPGSCQCQEGSVSDTVKACYDNAVSRMSG